MELDTIELSPQDVAELSEPFGPKHAMAGLKLGFAMGLSELGLTPAEFEKMAQGKLAVSGIADIIKLVPEGYGTLATLLTGAGALGGAYTGYARANVEQALDGKSDPETMELKRKLKGYQGLMSDLKRNNAIQSAPPAQIAA